MTFLQEQYANELFRELKRRFGRLATMGGADVNWRCRVGYKDSYCTIHCYESNGPEYYTSYVRSANECARSRNSSATDTASAVGDWINGHSVDAIQEKYPFVNEKKRFLIKIRDRLLSILPQIPENIEIKLNRKLTDSYQLDLHSKNRSCEIFYCGSLTIPTAVFIWDENPMFSFFVENDVLCVNILHRWLCENVMPSSLRSEYPWLEIVELADHYERRRPIEGEFLLSWDSITGFYNLMNYPCESKILKLISELRVKGFDTKLRAGQSLSSLILSRSRRHGLRSDQPHIVFNFNEKGMTVKYKVNYEISFEILIYDDIILTSEIERMLERLMKKEID